MDGRARADRRAGLPDGRAGPARLARRRPRRPRRARARRARRARRRRALPGGRRAAGGRGRAHARRTSCTCCARTACCTCSATTTPSPRSTRRCSACRPSCSRVLAEAAVTAARDPHRRSAPARSSPSCSWSLAGLLACLEVALRGSAGCASRSWSATGRAGRAAGCSRCSPTRRARSTCCCCCAWPPSCGRRHRHLVLRRPRCPGSSAVALAVAVMVVVSFVLVGVAPRTIGRQQAERVALLGAPVALVLTRVFGPLPRLLILVGNALTPGKGFREGPFASEAELRDLVDLAEERGVVEEAERDMIETVFELGDTIVREVMVPRTDMVVHRARQDRAPGAEPGAAQRLQPHPGRRRAAPTTSSASPTSRTSCRKERAEGGGGRPGRGRHARRRCSCPRASRSTTCCARCRPRWATSRSSSTSTAAPPGW